MKNIELVKDNYLKFILINWKDQNKELIETIKKDNQVFLELWKIEELEELFLNMLIGLSTDIHEYFADGFGLNYLLSAFTSFIEESIYLDEDSFPITKKFLDSKYKK